MIAIEQEILPFTIIPSRNTRSSTLSAITISDDFFDDCDISLDDNEKEQQFYDIRSTSIDEYEEEEGDLQAVQRNSAVSRFSSASNNTSDTMHKPERQRSVILMASNKPRRGGSSAESYLDNIPNLPSRRPSELLMEIRQQSGSDRSLLAPSTTPNFKNMMPPMKPARQHTEG